MTAPRKTIEVAYLLDTINDRLRKSVDEVPEARAAFASILEQVLMETGNTRVSPSLTATSSAPIPPGASTTVEFPLASRLIEGDSPCRAVRPYGESPHSIN